MFFLGIDSNVHRTVVVALDLELAAVVAEGSANHQFLAGAPSGVREQDPASWISALDSAVRQCLSRLGPGRDRVAGIGVSAQSHGVVTLDSDNRIIRPAKLAGDSSMWRESEEISQAFGGPPGMIELTGNVIASDGAPAFLHWLKKNEPQHYQRLATVLMPHDFLNYWLTSSKRMEFGDASACGLMDVRSRSWSEPLFNLIDPRLLERMPPLCSSRGAQGPLRHDLAASWGLTGEILVSAGGGLSMMEAIGAGNVSAGGVTVRLGQEGRVSGVSAEPIIDPRGEVNCFCDSTDQWMPTVATMAATDPLEMISSTFGWTSAQLEAAVSAAPCGAEGLVFLPPVESGDYTVPTRFLHGITRENYTATNLARSAAEGVALEFGHSLERIAELGFEPKHVHVAGDWSRSQVWRQLVANVLGLPVAAVKGGDGAALGAALQAAVTFFAESGEDLTYQEIAAYAAEPAEGSRCEPNLEEHERYREVLSRRQFLSESLRGSALS
ncbi:FGGY family carbohydrate kinase [Roseibacillus persicicus]|uniref:FGGY family carbohydrate kinase n=1 Tax=Roseibacillus persicicus TaxID=454148 RepID=UPI0028100691|nr:FGGY family carbohydrate kinase [Roseibacillus persicicus]MDQ8188692.1 FGGY family carbohydrate kinase [Roseibacillus persicicus]